jgi:hypothetical protein
MLIGGKNNTLPGHGGLQNQSAGGITSYRFSAIDIFLLIHGMGQEQ